jgi:hypothetical protein
MSPLTKRVPQIEKRVDHPPGHIIAERFHQQNADTATASPLALNVHVNVRTMMIPNKNSKILPTGSSSRLGFLFKLVDIPKVRSLNLRGSLAFANFYRQR